MGLIALLATGTFTEPTDQQMNISNTQKTAILLGLIALSATAKAEPTESLKICPFELSASYKGDFISNFHGGIKTGTTYLGLADLFIRFNTETASLWKGGELLIHGANTHGDEPSANLIGDFQVVSNIEAGNHSFLYELWYRQQFSKASATIGLQDLNAEFAVSEVGSNFINSSFGIHPIISDNVLAPIFPITSLGATFCWNASSSFNLKAAAYSGCPIDFDKNPYNIKWKTNYLNGLLCIAEGEIMWKSDASLDQTLKVGMFYHQHCYDEEESETETHDYGLYFVGDHHLLSKEQHALNMFYQIGVSPRNENYCYLGAGCSYTGLLSKKGKDMLGLAVACGMLTKTKGQDETAVELTYRINVTDQIFLQPEMQYVVHPGGTDSQLKNATVGLIRLGLEF